MEEEVEAEAEVEAEVLGSFDGRGGGGGGRGGGGGAWERMASEKGSEGWQVSSCLFLKEMPLAVYQSRV